MAKDKILQLKNVSVHFGSLQVLTSVDMSISSGEIAALQGPNGAGKSTLLRAIFGLAKLYSGVILWQGKHLTTLPYQVARLGIGYAPQGRRVFTNLTVEENLQVGGCIFHTEDVLKKKVEDVLTLFPALKHKRKARGGILSGGEQQMLTLARVLMTEPKLLLLDEPTLGLAPNIVKLVFQKIKQINKLQKITILIVEHNIKLLLKIADRVYVLDKGCIIASRTSKKMLRSKIKDVLMGK